MQADTAVLSQSIQGVVRASSLGERVQDIVLEQDQDEYGDDFLRVTLQLRSSARLKTADLTELVHAIRAVVSAMDDRFPSVRFSDAPRDGILR